MKQYKDYYLQDPETKTNFFRKKNEEKAFLLIK